MRIPKPMSLEDLVLTTALSAPMPILTSLFSGRISKQQLIAALQVRIFSNGAVSANKLVSLLTDKRRSYSLRMNVWGKAVDPGKVHGFVFMMLATGILDIKVKSQKLIGTDDLKLGHVEVGLGKTTIVATNDEMVETLAILDDAIWDQFFSDSLSFNTQLSIHSYQTLLAPPSLPSPTVYNHGDQFQIPDKRCLSTSSACSFSHLLRK